MSVDDNSLLLADDDFKSYFIPTKSKEPYIRVIEEDNNTAEHQRPPAGIHALHDETPCEESKAPDVRFHDLLSFAEDSNPAIFTVSSVDDSSGCDSVGIDYRTFPKVEKRVVVQGKRMREIALELASSSHDSSDSSTQFTTDKLPTRGAALSNESKMSDAPSNGPKINHDMIELETIMNKVGNPLKSLSHNVRLLPPAISCGSSQGRGSRLSNSPSSCELGSEPEDPIGLPKVTCSEFSIIELRAQVAVNHSDQRTDKSLLVVNVNDFPINAQSSGKVVGSNWQSRARSQINFESLSNLTNDGLCSIQSDLVLDNVDYLSVLEVASTDRDLSTIASISSRDAREVFCKRTETQDSNQISIDETDQALSCCSNGDLEVDVVTDEAFQTENESVLDNRGPENATASSLCQCLRLCHNPLEACFLILIAASAATLIILLVLLVQK